MFYLRNISPSLSVFLFFSQYIYMDTIITASNQLKGTLWEFSCKQLVIFIFSVSTKTYCVVLEA